MGFSPDGVEASWELCDGVSTTAGVSMILANLDGTLGVDGGGSSNRVTGIGNSDGVEKSKTCFDESSPVAEALTSLLSDSASAADEVFSIRLRFPERGEG